MSTAHIYVEINHASGWKVKPKLFNINTSWLYLTARGAEQDQDIVFRVQYCGY